MTAPGLRLNRRTRTVNKADGDLHAYLIKLAETYDLTYLEIACILADRQRNALIYALRAERHPDDPDRKADEE